MTKRAFVPATLFLFALAVLPGQSQAQNLSEGWVLTPKMETSAAFQEAFKSHMEFRVAQGEPWVWQTWECVVGVKTLVISWWCDRITPGRISTSTRTVTSLWSPEPISERRWGHCWKTHKNGIMQADTAFQSWPTDPAYEVNLIQMITFHLIPAKGMAFQEALAKFTRPSPERTCRGITGATCPSGWGVKGNSYSIVLLGESWADFAEPDPTMVEVVVEAYGQEEAMAIFASFAETYHKSESVMLRLRKDLSNLPEM